MRFGVPEAAIVAVLCAVCAFSGWTFGPRVERVKTRTVHAPARKITNGSTKAQVLAVLGGEPVKTENGCPEYSNQKDWALMFCSQ